MTTHSSTPQHTIPIAWRFAPSIVEAALHQLLPEAVFCSDCGQGCEHIDEPGLRHLRQAMRHAVFSGGKMLRAQLAMEAASVVGGPELQAETVLPVACALELIHAYSLVHDDLPAMDNAETRRGRPSCHRAFGEATAILVGDGLLTLAFETLARPSDVEPSTALRALAIIAKAAGEAGMVGGQQIDIDWSSEHVVNISGAQLLQMHAMKTGALIRASSEAGAVVAGGTEAEIAAMRAYGQHLGRAFQIHDDVLDVEGDPQVTGKTASDQANFKTTATAVFGIEGAKKLAREASEAATEALQLFGTRAQALRDLACFVVQRER